MHQTQNFVPQLRQLSELEKEKNQWTRKDSPFPSDAQIEALRARIPTAILYHHDRLQKRGKPSVAPITRSHCGACHLLVSRGRVVELRRNADALNICDHCGVFLYLAEDDQPEASNQSIVKVTPESRMKKGSARSVTLKTRRKH